MTWPAVLGEYPVPGDPAALRSLASSTATTVDQVGEAARALRRIAGDDALWVGEAGRAFRGRVAELPGQFDAAGRALDAVANDLRRHAAVLADAQAAARRMAASLPAAQGAELQDAAARLLPDVEALTAQVGVSAMRCAEHVRWAARLAPHDPPWWSAALHELDIEVGSFVREHIDVLTTVQAAVGVIGAVLTLAPGLAPIGLALGAASFAATLLFAHYGEADGVDVGLAFAGVAFGAGAMAVKGASEAKAAGPLATGAARAIESLGVDSAATARVLGCLGFAAEVAEGGAQVAGAAASSAAVGVRLVEGVDATLTKWSTWNDVKTLLPKPQPGSWLDPGGKDDRRPPAPARRPAPATP